MSTLGEFFDEVQRRSGLPPIPLIRGWSVQERVVVVGAIRHACGAGGLIGSLIPDFANRTNQSIGNAAATHCLNILSENLPNGNAMASATGPGYPDVIYSLHSSGVACCAELKATSNWNPRDTNRRVLTSSPAKLLRLIKSGEIQNPPAHIICTVIYDGQLEIVKSIRLDFLEPDTTVNIRLEASTSQSLLSKGDHNTEIIA